MRHLRGRETELELLGEALNRPPCGRLAVLVIEGEAGIGKTSLLDTALRAASDLDVAVFRGRAEELERTRPFGVISAALACSRSSSDPRRRAVADLLAAGGAEGDRITVSSDPGLRFQAVDALVDLVEALAEQPLAIALDDLQWADPSSVLTLAAMARRLVHAPAALICCLRPTPRSAELQRALDALDNLGATRIHLGQLDERAVHELVADTVAAEPGQLLMKKVAGAGGNPLFVTELLAAITEDGAVSTTDGHAEVADAVLPPTLRLTILRRLGFLPEQTLQALRPASILGSSFAVTDLSTITERSVLDLSGALHPALDARVLRSEYGRLRFRHDLIRDAIYEDVPDSVRLGLHREAGRRLADAGAPSLQVAEHLVRGATAGDGDAITWLTKAAREVALRSPRVASELFEHAIELLAPQDPERDRLIVERAVSLMWAGGVVDAEGTCRALLDGTHDPSLDGPARTCLAHSLIAEGRMAAALVELEQVCGSTSVTEEQRAGAWAWAGFARLSLGDLDGSALAATRSLQASRPAREHFATSLALTTLAMGCELRGEMDEAVRVIDEAMQLADLSPGRLGHRYPVHVSRGHILMERDRLADARQTLEIGSRISEEVGARWAIPSFHVYLAIERYLAGEWDDCVVEFETARELAAETGERYSLIIGHSVMSHLALHRGDLRKAGQAAAAATGELAATGPRYRSHWAPWAQAMVSEATGDIPGAFRALADCWDYCQEAGFAIEYPVLGPDLVRLALAAGDRSRAEQVTFAVEKTADASQVSSHRGAALRCRGLLDRESGLLDRACAAFASVGRPFEAAMAGLEAGELLARDGAHDRAVAHLDAAVEAFERLDAGRDLARAEACLRQLGVRRGKRGTRNRPRTGWASLTDTESRIVDLVSEGLSNPQIGERLFVSRRTVQTHLAHVFSKLDISSRAQLAAEAAGRR
jgi:DNA-binding CsgD family transcriptional regulator